MKLVIAWAIVVLIFGSYGGSAFCKTAGPAPQGQAPAAGEDASELAKKLSSPVAALISVPLQSNFDFGLGPNEDGFKYTLNFQPVIPISLNDQIRETAGQFRRRAPMLSYKPLGRS
jgi:hypothetical protein